MDTRALFGLSALMSFVASCVFAKLYVWPRLRSLDRRDALVPLVTPHMFFRFIGLSFLVPGVVSSSLPPAFAVPAGYGDLIAGLLAVAATLSLAKRASRAIAVVWIFNLWGAADLLFAGIQGARNQIDPGWFGAAFFIPTAIVPPLLVTHAIMFLLLIRRAQ